MLIRRMVSSESSSNQSSSCSDFDGDYNCMSLRYFMPYKSAVPVHELLVAMAGDRTCPRADKVIFEKMKVIMGYNTDPSEGGGSWELLKFRSPTLLRYRLNLKLALEERPPLMRPRWNAEWSMSYMVYCCLSLDAGNVTQWHDGPVDRVEAHGKNSSYLRLAWRVKFEAGARVQAMGCNREERKFASERLQQYVMKNAAWKIWDTGKPKNKKIYDRKIKRSKDKIVAHIKKMSLAAYKVTNKKGIQGRHAANPYIKVARCGKLPYYSVFEPTAFLAWVYDPLDATLPELFFTNHCLPYLVPAYKKFCKLSKQLDRTYSEDLSQQSTSCSESTTGTTKRFRDAFSPQWWKTYTEEERAAVLPLDENKDLNLLPKFNYTPKTKSQDTSLGKRAPFRDSDEREESRSSQKLDSSGDPKRERKDLSPPFDGHRFSSGESSDLLQDDSFPSYHNLQPTDSYSAWWDDEREKRYLDQLLNKDDSNEIENDAFSWNPLDFFNDH